MKRAVLAVLGVGLVAVVVVLATRGGGGSGGAALETAAGGTGEEGSRPAAPMPGGGPAMTPEEAAALERLERELAGAAPVEGRSDEEVEAAARAWVAANRDPDRPYNELEARILALMDVMVGGDKRSAEWMMNMSQIEVEMIRAIDADGDGQVTDDEVQLFIDENVAGMFNPMEHPYLQEKFDRDGDGRVSPEEMTQFGAVLNDGPLAGAIERGKLEAWDTDMDGVLSEEERSAGQEAAAKRAEEMFAGFAPEGEASRLAALTDEELAEMPAEQAAQMRAARDQMASAREMMASQLAAQDFMEAMRLDNMEQPEPEEMMRDMPKPPTDPMAFDADGDGSLSEQESAAHQEAMLAYQDEVQEWGAKVTALRLKDQFENATAQNDFDGDGRMSAQEWERRIDDLLFERDERLFTRSYDLNGSGRIEASELNRYVEWYRSGSLRADVNYDGSVDAADLQEMALRFQRQGG